MRVTPLKTFFQSPPELYSEKPRVFYDNIREHFPGSRLDIFGAGSQAGFDEWGYACSRVVGKSHYVSKPGGFYVKTPHEKERSTDLFSYEDEGS